MSFKTKVFLVATFAGINFLFFLKIVQAAPVSLPIPHIKIEVGRQPNPQEVGLAIQILVLLTVLSLAPAFIIMVTSFTRIIVILSLLRSALSLRQLPPNQVLIGLALFLTFFIMTPTWLEVKERAIDPYMKGKITYTQAWEEGVKPVKRFMLKHTRKKDLSLFLEFSDTRFSELSREEIPLHILIPSFITSELKTAFQIGFVLYLPFLIIDIVVSSIIMSMGMFMLPPMMISLPFKILLFVLIDGWNLVVESIITSFR